LQAQAAGYLPALDPREEDVIFPRLRASTNFNATCARDALPG